ncbi:hypothetical protein BGZ81_000529 [Podila clonocystis]|nr:hypothetical protein BGZ81_000529 [Podila clonocystis]
MAIKSPGLLKASLWLQAAVLLVLTLLLADAGAWIGAILTAVGGCFSLIGIGAAHKRSMGYLYCYTTLMGAWSLLAITHVLIVCGLVTLPESLMDEVLVVGKRILEDSADPMTIVIPSLYGVQCFAWCGSLACIAITRAAASDPTLGFEIQSPTTTHRLDMVQQQRVGRRQSIFGFRKPSTISPLGSYEHGNKLSQKDFATHNLYRDGTEEELDGQRIIIPNNRRISQVVVTFRSDLDSIQMDTTRMNTEIHAPEAAVIPPQKSAIYITNHNYSLKDSTYTSIPFTLPGESLSDMIFSAVQNEQPIIKVSPPKAQEVKIPLPEQGPSVQRRYQEQEREQEPRLSESSNHTVSTVASTTATKKSAADLTTISSTTTLDEGLDTHGSFDVEREPHPQVSSMLSKDQVQQLEKIQQQRQYQQQHHQSTWQLLMEQDRKQCMEKQQVAQHATFPIVPTRRSSFNHQYHEKEKELDFSSPAIQSNSSDPSDPSFSTTDRHISIATTITSVILPKDQPPSSPVVSPVSASRSKSGVLKYWKKNRSSDSSVSSEESSISQGYFANAFSNKKSKAKPAMIVPSIVLHPDEEDGEPPRVLSQKDIEYLSTAPPVPLRPLIQPWDEPEESHDGYGDGYDYDYDYDSYHQEEEVEEEESEESQEGDEGRHQLVEGEYDDPYALDVPINLEIDLQGLEHGEVKGYGYI